MLQKHQRVIVSKPIQFHGPSPWINKAGKVVKMEPGWYWVLLEGDSEGPIPFKERELSAA